VTRGLPKRLHRSHKAYYYVCRIGGKVKWRKLSADYGEALRMWADLEGGKAPNTWTVEQAIGHYLDVSSRRLKPATLTGYAGNAKSLIPVFGKMLVGDLTKAHVYQYVVKRGNVAGNRERALLSAVYAHLAKAGIFAGENPAAGLQFRNPEGVGKRYVTDGELSVLMAKSGERMRLLVRFAYLTGARQRDVLAMRVSSATEAGIAFTESKTGKDRLIGWTDELRTLWRLAAGVRVGSVPLFLARKGAAYTSSGFRASWRRVKIRAGLPEVTFHDLRRKSGSDADTEADAQALLGHSDGKITHKHYRAKLVAVKPIERLNVRQNGKR
jgi:integrase